MQLEPPGIRGRLSAAACVLLASGAGAARGDTPPKWQFDGSGLLYGESKRAQVVEPTARLTRFFSDGQILSATLGIDAITGASPTGAIPTTTIQTTTTPSGNIRTTEVGTVPTNRFKDARGSLDLDWEKPFGNWLTTSLGTHFSREKDYQSLGGSGKVSLSFMHRLSTITVGGGYNHDGVFPTGGTRAPLADSTVIIGTGTNPKSVSTVMVGVSRVLSRRWMVGLTGTRTLERGYLTEPYTVLSVVDPTSGDPVGQLTEKRPSTRDRRDVLASSVYHLDTGVLYLSDRYYWDDWGIRSNTLDVRYRHALEQNRYVEPHVRYYIQTRANFFRYYLLDGDPPPDYASADHRVGPLQSVTLGGTFGFRIPDHPGDWAVRAEYILQWGKAHPQEAFGNQLNTNMSPPVSGGSVVVQYTLKF
jgi:Protein of unknown function (DUF3570)